MRVFVIENSPTAPMGAFGRHLRDVRGATLDQYGPEEALAAEDRAIAADLVVTLGSPRAAYETGIAWIPAQQAMLRRLQAAARPVIGICFGAQMLAAALGGSAAMLPGGRVCQGWMTNDAVEDVWRGPWMRWHGDHCTAPPGAEVIATADGILQAFRLGSALGVQFHPEADEAIVAGWIGLLPAEGRWAPQHDAAALLAETREHMAADAGRRAALYDAMLGMVMGVRNGRAREIS
jgi:GMP synthase (glutamine-hydrolysing)